MDESFIVRLDYPKKLDIIYGNCKDFIYDKQPIIIFSLKCLNSLRQIS